VTTTTQKSPTQKSNAQKSNAEITQTLQRKGHLAFSWDELDKIELPTGIVTSTYRVGLPDDPEAPTVFKVYYPPECFVEAHTHACDYTEIVLEGTIRVGAQWHKAGDIRIGLANRGYGPLVAGPEGAHLLFIFADGRWPAITIGRRNDGSTLGSDVIAAHLDAQNP
jgi:quercetin dioxygenase-like cupin family protein